LRSAHQPTTQEEERNPSSTSFRNSQAPIDGCINKSDSLAFDNARFFDWLVAIRKRGGCFLFDHCCALASPFLHGHWPIGNYIFADRVVDVPHISWAWDPPLLTSKKGTMPAPRPAVTLLEAAARLRALRQSKPCWCMGHERAARLAGAPARVLTHHWASYSF
jgi:hypothetical protein